MKLSGRFGEVYFVFLSHRKHNSPRKTTIR